MAYAKTQKGALMRVNLKHQIRRMGGVIASNATTANIKSTLANLKSRLRRNLR